MFEFLEKVIDLTSELALDILLNCLESLENERQLKNENHTDHKEADFSGAHSRKEYIDALNDEDFKHLIEDMETRFKEEYKNANGYDYINEMIEVIEG